MTNILLLPQLGIVNADGSISPGQFYVATNADWPDVVPFTDPDSGDPIDISGIAFAAKLRAAPGASGVLLSIGTADGTLVNGGSGGLLKWAVPAGRMVKLANQGAQAFMDILASADGREINLCARAGAAMVNIRQGIT